MIKGWGGVALKRFALLCTLAAFTSQSLAFSASTNYATCILTNMPGAQHDMATYQISRACADRHGMEGPFTPTIRMRALDPKDWRSCGAKYGRDTRSENAVRASLRACRMLYPPV